MIIEKNKVVTFHYTLKDDNGEIIDTSSGKDPLAYIQGTGSIVIGLENEMEGKKIGDAFEVSVNPAEGYGEVNNDLIRTLPKEQFKHFGDQLVIGLNIYIESPQGQIPATIVDINDEDVSFDMNHPLAGKKLNFSIEVTDIRDASAEELDHGHVHGPGGHEH